MYCTTLTALLIQPFLVVISEYVNLMDLFKDPATDHLILVNGQLVVMRTDQRSPRSSKTITDIFTWLHKPSVHGGPPIIR